VIKTSQYAYILIFVFKGNPKFPWKITQFLAGGMAEVVEHLPSKCKTLSSNPNIDKTK
jgi:hypothetical protein